MPLVQGEEIACCEGVVISEAVARELNLPAVGKVCNVNEPLRIKGFDGKWRCRFCHKIHAELVYADTKLKTKAPA
jgi:hypothetical protein